MPIIAVIPLNERRVMERTVQKNRDKACARRPNALLRLPQGISATQVAKTRGAARSIYKGHWVQQWLAVNPKFTLLYQPIDSPWGNRIEKVWLTLHGAVARNQQRRSMWQLLRNISKFMAGPSSFPRNQHELARL